MRSILTWLGGVVLTVVVCMGGHAPLSGFAAASDAGASCDDWNTEEFFEIASAGEVTACLEAGTEPNTRDEKGRIPLHLAAAFTQHPGVIVALIQAGADFKAIGRNGENPLHTAATYNEKPRCGHRPARGWRQPEGPGPMVKHGRTPLEMAALRNTNPEVLDALLTAGADPKSKKQVRSDSPPFRGSPELESSHHHRFGKRRRRSQCTRRQVSQSTDSSLPRDRVGGSSRHRYRSGGSRRRPQCTNGDISRRQDSFDPCDQAKRPSRRHRDLDPCGRRPGETGLVMVVESHDTIGDSPVSRRDCRRCQLTGGIPPARPVASAQEPVQPV